MFVLDVADNLLQHVFQRDQADDVIRVVARCSALLQPECEPFDQDREAVMVGVATPCRVLLKVLERRRA